MNNANFSPPTNPKGLREQYLTGLIRLAAIRIEEPHNKPFTLRSGKQSRIYIDQARMATDPTYFCALIQNVAELISDKENAVVVNVDSKISPQMTGALSFHLKIPQLIYKSDTLVAVEKGAGLQLTFPTNSDITRKNIWIVDDVGTGGSTIINVAKTIRDHPSYTGQTIYAVVGTVREPDQFIQTLKDAAIHTLYIATLDEVLTAAWNKLTHGQQKSIRQERPAFKNIQLQ